MNIRSSSWTDKLFNKALLVMDFSFTHVTKKYLVLARLLEGRGGGLSIGSFFISSECITVDSTDWSTPVHLGLCFHFSSFIHNC